MALLTLGAAADVKPQTVPGRWSLERATGWYAKQPWLVGCNYIPANAINQLEMWQEETFNPGTIDKELALAESIGFNTLRVYLHDLVWGADEKGLYKRMDRFLDICARHKIRPMFVFFDDCHSFDAKTGRQPLPVPEYHNSGWKTSPRRDLAIAYSQGKASDEDQARLQGYVKKTMQHFKDDDRVLMWELYNEPGRGGGAPSDLGSNKGGKNFGNGSAQLLLDAWKWARAANPSQPVCSTAEGSLGNRNKQLALMNSDIISFHTYQNAKLGKLCEKYVKEGRPAICTEYMGRPKSTFQSDLPILKKHGIGAINWGFVAGKTGCVYPWGSRNGKDLVELRKKGVVCETIDDMPLPEVWFHEIFHPDHTPFDQAEIDVIKKLTGKL